MAGSATVEKRLDFGLLGPLQMTIDGTPVPSGTPKQRAVLAMLVINRNRPVGVDALITALWEEWPPSGARGPRQHDGGGAGAARACDGAS